MKDLIETLKEFEGLSLYVYKDTLSIPTIGYGTKLPLTKEEAELLLKHRLEKTISEVEKLIPVYEASPKKIKDVLVNMAYQLGTHGLLKFKKFLKALEEKDYEKAAEEMLDSKWRYQTPNRAKALSSIVRSTKNDTTTA